MLYIAKIQATRGKYHRYTSDNKLPILFKLITEQDIHTHIKKRNEFRLK